MPAEHDQLREALENLQSQLDEMREIDPDVAHQLEATIAQAKTVLSGDSSASEAPHGSIAQRLSDAVQTYEATHPTLAGNLGAVIRALGDMGI